MPEWSQPQLQVYPLLSILTSYVVLSWCWLASQVFFIRDGFKFPDLVHALRPNPKNNIQEAWRFLDFLSHHPESAHVVSAHACANVKA